MGAIDAGAEDAAEWLRLEQERADAGPYYRGPKFTNQPHPLSIGADLPLRGILYGKHKDEIYTAQVARRAEALWPELKLRTLATAARKDGTSTASASLLPHPGRNMKRNIGAFRAQHPPKKSTKKQINWRLSDTARSIVSVIAQSLEISQGNALEIILREEATRRNITLPHSK